MPSCVVGAIVARPLDEPDAAKPSVNTTLEVRLTLIAAPLALASMPATASIAAARRAAIASRVSPSCTVTP